MLDVIAGRRLAHQVCWLILYRARQLIGRPAVLSEIATINVVGPDPRVQELVDRYLGQLREVPGAFDT